MQVWIQINDASSHIVWSNNFTALTAEVAAIGAEEIVFEITNFTQFHKKHSVFSLTTNHVLIKKNI